MITVPKTSRAVGYRAGLVNETKDKTPARGLMCRPRAGQIFNAAARPAVTPYL
jgi:hypothetical protein